MFGWLLGGNNARRSAKGLKEPRQFTLPENTRIYAVGDIHARPALLQRMLQQIEADSREHVGKEILQIFLGDYIDRGPDGKAVIELLMQEPPKGHQRICLKGNHEKVLLDYMEDPGLFRSWTQYGGLATLMTYGVQMPMDVSEETEEIIHRQFCDLLPKAHYEWLKALPCHFSIGDYYFVHAGVNPDVPLEEQTPFDQLWIRREFLDHQAYFEQYIVHGHTPLEQPELLPHRANLDINEAETDQLACLLLEGADRRLMLV